GRIREVSRRDLLELAGADRRLLASVQVEPRHRDALRRRHRRTAARVPEHPGSAPDHERARCLQQVDARPDKEGMMENAIVEQEPKHRPVASTLHSLVFLGIAAGVTIAGFAAQSRQVAGGGLVESHVHVIPIYASVTAMNWLLALFAWKGIRKR